jgi:hypothetical protein
VERLSWGFPQRLGWGLASSADHGGTLAYQGGRVGTNVPSRPRLCLLAIKLAATYPSHGCKSFRVAPAPHVQRRARKSHRPASSSCEPLHHHHLAALEKKEGTFFSLSPLHFLVPATFAARIRSPFGGRVVFRRLHPRSALSPGTLIALLLHAHYSVGPAGVGSEKVAVETATLLRSL